MNAAVSKLTGAIRADSERLIRAVLGAFFVSLWATGRVLLTPELTTSLPYVPWLQLAIAACMLWRPSLPVGGMGIVLLYGMAIQAYGLFHLLDYPIFLGLALYLTFGALRRTAFGLTPLAMLRWLTAITLMWASVEKWAYPGWSFPLLIVHPTLAVNLDPLRYMTMAGVVEFGLAFGLLCSPLARKSAAVVLCAIFLSAVPEFGKVDALGHAPIIMSLVAIAAEDEGALGRLSPVLAPAVMVAAIAVFLVAYYGLHAALFGVVPGP